MADPENTTTWQQAVKALLEWMKRDQPRGAVLRHHGVGLSFTGGSVALCDGHDHKPILIFHGPQRPAANDVLDALADHGVLVDRFWGRPPAEDETSEDPSSRFTSFALAGTFSAGLRAAFTNYRNGCPAHPLRHVFCTCGWYEKGYSLLRLPEVAP